MPAATRLGSTSAGAPTSPIMKHDTPRRIAPSLCLLSLALLADAAAAQTLQETAKLVPLDGVANDWAGSGVALSGERALIGAPGDDDLGLLSGSAYLFTRGAAGWSQEAKLRASDGSTGCRFGWSAAMAGDTAVVGALFGNGAVNTTGAAYVFTRTTAGWVEQAKLPGGALADWFGYAVGLSGDTLVVGAPQRDDLGPDSGAVYVYERAGGAWIQSAVLHGADTSAGDHFGQSLSLLGDRLVVGAPEDAVAGAQSGSAYVFERVGGAWLERQKLVASNASALSWFGQSVHTDGLRVAVGAYRGDDAPSVSDAGAAYVFAELGGAWVEEERLSASDAVPGDEFGWRVHLAGDELLVSADHRVGRSGGLYRFRRVGGAWVEQQVLVAADATTTDKYGWDLARDGARVLVGARDALSPNGRIGAGYVLEALEVGTSYCWGDGSGTPCPCGNGGAAGEGCANSSGSGAALTGSGSLSVAADDLGVAAARLLPGQPALLFAGLNAPNGGDGLVFGDGLRCAGGGVQRLGVRVPDAAGGASWGPGLAGTAGWSAGDLRRLQGWYRDPQGSPCGAGFNLTNGLELALAP